MTIPVLSYTPSSQNQRVAGYEVPGEEQPRIFTTNHNSSAGEMDEVIWAAYRQIFNEQQLLKSNRQNNLESQLRSGQITVKDFIRGLALSDTFRYRNYEPNSNYRFVQMCVQRILGRDVYSDREKLAWSTVLATKGLAGFIDALLGSQEYLTNFGEDTVPYQRRRILPHRSQGDLPFARMPRYGEDHLAKLKEMGYLQNQAGSIYNIKPAVWDWQKQPYPIGVQLAGKIFAVTGAGLLALGLVSVALSAWGIIDL
jgi:phycobilisome rod-core linker protein